MASSPSEAPRHLDPSPPRSSSSSSSSSSTKTNIATSSGVSHGGANVTFNGSASNAPPGHFIRRVKTLGEVSSPSTASTMRPSPMVRQLSSDSSESAMPPRRNSSFSEYSLSEARDILNPRPQTHFAHTDDHDSSPLASLSLAFALLPAAGGIFFKNGSSIVTDVMLLGLAAVFLHWSVTQPWLWYHAAQEVRVREEMHAEIVVEDESDDDSQGQAASTNTTQLEDVPEEEEASEPEAHEPKFKVKRMTERQQSALKELYRYEVLALTSCFALPLLSAYLLHAIRSQLSRPSEGLVSNYNLTIFLMISELRVFSHLIKLLQSRTLHLQKIVHESPFASRNSISDTQLDQLLGRLERLESLSASNDQLLVEQGATLDTTKATLARDVRGTIQPELDALNRAVRRYEKKATLLQLQTEARFNDVHVRLDDAIALAAAAAKNHVSRKSIFQRAFESICAIIMFPFNALLQIVSLPLKPILALISRKKQQPQATPRVSRSSRNGKAPVPVRYSGDRVPTRLTKR